MLNGRLGLGLAPDRLDRVVAAAGGWITGVRLLGEAAARGGPDADLPGPPDLLDYLDEEILAALPADVREFLLDTAVLDVLTPAACAAVACRDDAAGLLARLARSHPFLLHPGPDGDGHRVQPLLRGLLRDRLAAEPARAADRHRRAAGTCDTPAERVEHLLAAGAHAEAADELERLARTMARPAATAGRAAAWTARLDPPHRDRPWLAALGGVDLVARGDLRRGAALLESALAGFEAAGDVRGRWLAVRHLHLATNDLARFGPVLDELERHPEFAALPVGARVEHHVGAGYGALHAGDWDGAAARFAAAIDLTTATRDGAAVEVLAQHLGPLPAACDGGVERLDAYAAWVRAHVPDPSPLVRLGMLHQLAIAAFLRGRLDDATAAAEAASGLPERLGGLPYLRATLDWLRAAGAHARGDDAAALAVLTRTDTPPATDLDHLLRLVAHPLRARILRRRRDEAGLATLVREVGAVGPSWRYAGQLGLVATAVRAQAAWAARDLDGAAALLRGALDAEERLRLWPGVGSLRLDLALVLADAGRTAEASRVLDGLLGTLARRGWPGLLVAAGREAVPLLAAADRGAGRGVAAVALAALRGEVPVAPAPVPGTGEVLSRREVEVLRLLADGVSNVELAERLAVSVNTAKTHVGRILTKLDARSRSQAVARARALHLI